LVVAAEEDEVEDDAFGAFPAALALDLGLEAIYSNRYNVKEGY
jgi:hypothetical protein